MSMPTIRHVRTFTVRGGGADYHDQADGCGGITELIKISALADAHNVMVVPHGSSVYSYHFVVTRHNSPFAEFLMMAPDADQVVPMFTPLLLDGPRERVRGSGAPGNTPAHRGGGAVQRHEETDVLLKDKVVIVTAARAASAGRSPLHARARAPTSQSTIGVTTAHLMGVGRPMSRYSPKSRQ